MNTDHHDATKPLISHPQDSSEIEEDPIETGDTTASSPSLFVWLLTLTAALSGLLFGYDTGVISSTLVSIRDDLSGRTLTTIDKSLITGITSLGALIASPLSGVLADTWGRRPVILLSDVLFVVGAVWQALTSSVAGMVLGRLIVGLAIGAAAGLTPLYIAETSPAAWRGRLVTISVLFITGGQVVAYVIGWVFAPKEHGWRWMVGLGAVPAGLQVLGFMILPETPRWLVRARKDDEARRVLEKIYAGEEAVVTTLLKGMQREIEKERFEFENGSQWEVLKSTMRELGSAFPANRRALIIACTLQAAQQLCGFVSFYTFYTHHASNTLRTH